MIGLLRPTIARQPLSSLSILAQSSKIPAGRALSLTRHLPQRRYLMAQSACATLVIDRTSSWSSHGRLYGSLDLGNSRRWLNTGPGKEDEAQREQSRSSSRRSRSLLTGAGVLAVLAGKGKWVLAAAKLTKFSSLISMMATTCTYALFFGFPYAFGMVSLIAIHEAGHALLLHRLGIPFSPAVFVPFMGAVINMTGRPKDVKEEAYVAIGGPVLGGAAAIGCSFAGIALDSPLLVSLADFGLMINLFNLLPIGQLDGGRIAGALSKWFLVGGLGVGGAMIYQGVVYNPIFYLIMLSATYSTYERFFVTTNVHPSYYKMHNGERLIWSASYFGLIAVLLGAMAVNNRHKKSIRELRREAQVPESTRSEEERFLDNVISWNQDDPYFNQSSEGALKRDFDEDYLRDYFGDDKST